nr:hypothetical protein [Tanacetum cinerariifolium]
MQAKALTSHRRSKYPLHAMERVLVIHLFHTLNAFSFHVYFLSFMFTFPHQEQSATSDAERLGLGFANDAEKLQKRASAKTVPSGSIPVPTGSIPVPCGDTMVSTDDVPVHTSSPSDSFFDDEPTTRFPSPSNLGNHDPSPGIFSSSSYDDEFGAALTNAASTMDVSPVATKRINTIHP